MEIFEGILYAIGVLLVGIFAIFVSFIPAVIIATIRVITFKVKFWNKFLLWYGISFVVIFVLTLYNIDDLQ